MFESISFVEYIYIYIYIYIHTQWYLYMIKCINQVKYTRIILYSSICLIFLLLVDRQMCILFGSV